MRVRYNKPKPTARDLEQSAARKARLRSEGLCLHCGHENDRAGLKTKNGRAATTCSKCLRANYANVERRRKAAQANVGAVRRALGLPDEG